MPKPRILIAGTADTKSDELLYLRAKVEAAGGHAVVMDVGVLEGASFAPDITNSQVAQAAGTTIEQVKSSGDENTAMTLMALGASNLAVQWHLDGRIDGMLALGGTMGTDLALDMAVALPLGVPKVVLTTVAHSHLIPPERIAPDLIAILWSGGLYGLNSICRAALSQAAGAVVGACVAIDAPRWDKPMVGITSLGKSCLSYMVRLKPALELRGYEVAVFHTTGMGGRAFESLAREGRFAAVMDFSLQELANHIGGSCVTSGPDRLLGAGLASVPQLVAPGAADMVDYAAWAGIPAAFAGQAAHAHNRLIASTSAPVALRLDIAKRIGQCLSQAKGPTCFLLPNKGIQAWDKPGESLHDAAALTAFVQALQSVPRGESQLVEIDAHINDTAFSDLALKIFDQWVAEGKVVPGRL